MIGAGIVTCNRPEFLVKCVTSIPDYVDHLVVINDGAQIVDIEKLQRKRSFKYIHNKRNIGVGKSKNILFKELLNAKCDHIFLIEDDIIVKDESVFRKYIEASEITGIQHFMFGYHGPANRAYMSKGPPTARAVIDYGKYKIALNEHSVGAFCYYSRLCLEKVGLLDEQFFNAFEHVDHDYRIAKEGMSTPYWNWPDLANSYELLDELECSEKSSTIRCREDWEQNIKNGIDLFEKKHGYLPAWNNPVPDTPMEKIVEILKQIKKTYAKK